jgi:hypothetical protein
MLYIFIVIGSTFSKKILRPIEESMPHDSSHLWYSESKHRTVVCLLRLQTSPATSFRSHGSSERGMFKTILKNVRFEIFTAVTMKNVVF